MTHRAALLPVAGIVGVVLAWWSFTTLGDVPEFFLPSPPQIFDAFLAKPDYLLGEAWITLIETLAGFAIAAAAGLLIGVALAASRTADRVTLPVFVALNAVPKVALAPLLLFWLGFGLPPKITLVAIMCFFPILLAVKQGLTSAPIESLELAASLCASRGQTFLKIRIHYALPQIFLGLKTAINLAVIGAVVAELSNPERGLGTVISRSTSNFDTPAAFAAIVLLAVISVALFYGVALIERLLLPWARDTSG
ncbi:ABC transporter permease [Catenuloplanes japonicus]|uniref:ABC transporter permease n=1 Tax=Catenuloplanes japonicus TaxID=33876 RepID=UPI00068B1E4A|nr:ABC transporter permease [Catenuloplanes japonicus]